MSIYIELKYELEYNIYLLDSFSSVFKNAKSIFELYLFSAVNPFYLVPKYNSIEILI